MPRKRYKSEEIVAKLRQVDCSCRSRYGRRDRPDWRERCNSSSMAQQCCGSIDLKQNRVI